MTDLADLLSPMRERVLRHTRDGADETQLETAVPRLSIAASRTPGEQMPGVYQPMICLVLQGAKQVTVGSRVLRYDSASCFLASMEVPAMGCIMEATPEEPYVVTALRIDFEMLGSVLAQMPPEPPTTPLAGFGVAPVTRELLIAWDSLLALLDRPEDIGVLGAGREREVLYRLLCSGHGPLLRQIGREDSRLSRVRRAVATVRDRFDQTLRIETLAEIAGMSVPTFHRHFKAATGLSPLQYQKTLRLQAARQLLSNSHDAARAAFAVGYESASQFSREYARQFGAPPSRDFARAR
ncbi:AraC family transcriptional regulator [Novosphingobium sp. 9]|uniref:AraC family transcriptional regulator n=1 Tax=Novosphingobium sp. 9 TaxID=2025349 RepID=UPI0021B564FA|nr:AraC family transcriptional regulator [Novosphingobium sp. 9]